MKKTVLAALLLPSLALGQTAANVSINTQELEIDGLVVAEMSGRWRASLKGNPGLTQFTLINVARSQPFPASTAGAYQGVGARYEPDSTDRLSAAPCATASPTNPAEVAILLSSDMMFLQYAARPGTTCYLTGKNSLEGAHGTFDCTDFNSGTWTSAGSQILDTTLSLKLALKGSQCDYDLHFTGLRVN